LGEPRVSIFERVQHIFAGKRERIVFDEYRLVTPAAFTSEHQGTRVFRGDVLLTVVGAIGRTAVVDDDQPFVLQRSAAVVGGQKGIVPHFLSKAFLNPPFQQWLNDDAKGTAQKGIYLKALGSAQIAVPPLAEQRRIVAKIDSLSTKSRRARDQLDHIPRLVEKYKQAILAAAFRGELTREWRNSNVVHINWITSTIGDVATIASGQTPKGIEAILSSDGEVPWFKVSSMNEAGNLGGYMLDVHEDENVGALMVCSDPAMALNAPPTLLPEVKQPLSAGREERDGQNDLLPLISYQHHQSWIVVTILLPQALDCTLRVGKCRRFVRQKNVPSGWSCFLPSGHRMAKKK
jgi:Type I restriction modification DNA specificity domain